MGVFQNIVVKKYLSGLDAKVAEAYKTYSGYFLNSQIQENIRQSKEEQFQEGFLRELFVKVLGYTLNPDPDYNLITEQKNEKDSKKADAAIRLDGEVVGVIELKDHKTTDLKQVEAQAFSYKNNHRNASYVIISNFEKLRFYIDNAVEFEEFNLFALSKAEFTRLWLFLSFESISKGLPKQIKSESVNSEQEITKELYRDYSKFKRELFANLVENNPDYDKLTLFKKSQKLLDRLLFIFFAEDKGLLPANSVIKIIDQWRKLTDLDEYRPLYERLKKYFGYLNTGHKGKTEDIFAYNGGLFAPDEVLDNVTVADEVLEGNCIKLCGRNFDSEVDVNILGHIFENSLTEIEEITAEITTGEKPTSKRKKDGVFYTPRYITTYIVENTLGKLCTEKRAELQIDEADYFADVKRQKATKLKLDQKLHDYRAWLLSLTICDPACGSGAFLNAALDFLIAEHTLIDEMTAKLHGGGIVFPDVENAILEKNLFGVDINDESIEIARLSLWLRTAKPHRKLNSLSSNIKCGNSLISDPTVAGDKAFDWPTEFPQVFANGGFDVVIGNPPYVHLESIKDVSETLSKCSYKTFDKRGDLYCLFVEHGFNIIKTNGFLSYIMPNKWLQAGYGKPLRELFLNYELTHLIDFGDIQIFEGATTYPCIFISRKDNTKEYFDVSVLQKTNADDFYSNVALTLEKFKTSDFGSQTWIISSKSDKDLLKKLQRSCKTLSDFVGNETFRGILTGLSEAFVIDNNTKDYLIGADKNSAEIIKPMLRGRDITRYNSESASLWLINSHNGVKLKNVPRIAIESYPAVKTHLDNFLDKLCNRTDKGDTDYNLRNCAYLDLFERPKIMYQAFQVKPCFIYDDQGLFCNNSMWFIPTNDKGILAILNSKLGWWLISKYCTQIQNGYQLIWKYFGQIPIASTTTELSNLADKMLAQNKELTDKRQKFINRLSDNFEGIRITGALEKFDELVFKGFVAELKKQKIALSLKQQDEWEEYFNAYKTECNALTTQITTTDHQIDQMVYTLYNLTPAEIAVIEK